MPHFANNIDYCNSVPHSARISQLSSTLCVLHVRLRKLRGRVAANCNSQSIWIHGSMYLSVMWSAISVSLPSCEEELLPRVCVTICVNVWTCTEYFICIFVSHLTLSVLITPGLITLAKQDKTTDKYLQCDWCKRGTFIMWLWANRWERRLLFPPLLCKYCW